MAARLEDRGRPARDRHGSGTQGWLAWPRLTAVAELATIGAGYLGCALVRLAIHVAAGENGWAG